MVKVKRTSKVSPAMEKGREPVGHRGTEGEGAQ